MTPACFGGDPDVIDAKEFSVLRLVSPPPNINIPGVSVRSVYGVMSRSCPKVLWRVQ